eukprot:CAMPEP_0202711532 /NCGR_PEP_ID=MMETSP1385-20130828/23318_1 /ASSEMBLY_ACC=CAM_ASM_000861 /TAXON_ID=933848 /ORGANISM="Elphidium margaritaceum" /LENGTH=809 /DNA_ID=CAMNT_0049371285 /DNA_START=29 /DNA_END=2458 /DNA_ORIENTATION=+
MAEQRVDISTALEAKLQRRPSTKEAGHGVDTKLASSLQATAKQLENAQKKDLLDQNLKSRATADEIGLNTSVAASIQPTAKTLQNKLRRDSLKQTLSMRPDIAELIDSGILKPYSTRLASSLQCDADELEQALAHQVPRSYLQQIGILDPYKKHVDVSSIDMEHASALLLHALVYRPSEHTVMAEKGGQQFGYQNVSDSLQETAKKLDMERKKDKISSTLSQRASAEQVMQEQVASMGYNIDPKVSRSLQQSVHELGREMIKDVIRDNLQLLKTASHHRRRRSSSFDAEQLAPSLQAVANTLAMEQKRNTLKQQLAARPHSTRQLIRDGILKPFAKSLAARLQLNADILEQQLAVRMDAEQLKAMGILEPYKKHVDVSSIHADVEHTANLILKSLALKKQRRESGGGGGGAAGGVAPVLQATLQKLEKQQTKDALSAKLKNRRSDVVAAGQDGHQLQHVAPALQSTAKKLQFAQKQDTVSSTLNTRSSPPFDCAISPAIQSMAKQLASCRRRDSLKSQVLSRPDMQDVMDDGILKPYAQRLARSLQLEANELEHALASQVPREYLVELGILEPYRKHVDAQPLDVEHTSALLLRALIARRDASPSSAADASEVVRRQSNAFGFEDKIAGTLQQTAKQLDTAQKKDKLSTALKQREDVHDVMQKQMVSLGYDANVAPSLTQTIKELGRAMIKDKLEQALKMRPSAEAVQRVGVDVKHASKIQSAMHDLEYAQRRDSISKNIQQRPSAIEAGVDTQLARGLSAIAKTLEMEMKADRTAHSLQDSGVIKKQNTESVLAIVDRCITFLNDFTL